MRALISVEDKTELVSFARELVDMGWEIISTGRTAATIRQAAIPVIDVADVTHFAEMLDGRVKTLHPAIHGGILARRDNPEHMRQLTDQHFVPIDLVVCNLYDFANTIAKPDITVDDAIEHIDIGGVALLRAAAKNHDAVTVIHAITDYQIVITELRSTGTVSSNTRRQLAASAFAHTAAYDGQIAMYLAGLTETLFPTELTLPLERLDLMRYGENPHQKAAFYRWRAPDPAGLNAGLLANADVLHGKKLGFNNLVDLDAALSIVSDFAAPTVAIVKHAGPCGIASDASLETAFRQALACDPVSAYGGIIGLNRKVDLATALAIKETHFDAIIAPDYDDDALGILEKKKNQILVATRHPVSPRRHDESFATLEVRRLSGGLLVQTTNQLTIDEIQRNIVTERAPTKEEWQGLLFAWQTVKHVKSNAIVLAKGSVLVGIGGGQPNRVDSVRIAATRAGSRGVGSVLASDAYFPFADNIDEAVKAGVTAIIQPGGSIRDQEVIAAANQHDLAMVFTGFRHFRH